MRRTLLPYDPGWTCRSCGAAKLAGNPLCDDCSSPRGGTKSDPRIKLQAPTSGPTNKEEKETMGRPKRSKNQATTAPKGGYHKRVAEQVSRAVLAVTRAEKLVRDVEPWKQEALTKAAKDGITAMKTLVTAFEALPQGFAPTTVNTGIGAGDKVSIAALRREQYVGFMPTPEMGELEVVLVIGSRVQVKTPAGVLHVVPRGHLHRPQAEAK